jgi:hypothetical protein
MIPDIPALQGVVESARHDLVHKPRDAEEERKMRSTEPMVASFVLNFTSFLLLFPGHPDHGPFYLIHGLLNAIQKYAPW